MIYTLRVEIEKPIEDVIALFDSVDNLYEWMVGLKVSNILKERRARSEQRQS